MYAQFHRYLRLLLVNHLHTQIVHNRKQQGLLHHVNPVNTPNNTQHNDCNTCHKTTQTTKSKDIAVKNDKKRSIDTSDSKSTHTSRDSGNHSRPLWSNPTTNSASLTTSILLPFKNIWHRLYNMQNQHDNSRKSWKMATKLSPLLRYVHKIVHQYPPNLNRNIRKSINFIYVKQNCQETSTGPRRKANSRMQILSQYLTSYKIRNLIKPTVKDVKLRV